MIYLLQFLLFACPEWKPNTECVYNFLKLNYGLIRVANIDTAFIRAVNSLDSVRYYNDTLYCWKASVCWKTKISTSGVPDSAKIDSFHIFWRDTLNVNQWQIWTPYGTFWDTLRPDDSVTYAMYADAANWADSAGVADTVLKKVASALLADTAIKVRGDSVLRAGLLNNKTSTYWNNYGFTWTRATDSLSIKDSAGTQYVKIQSVDTSGYALVDKYSPTYIIGSDSGTEDTSSVNIVCHWDTDSIGAIIRDAQAILGGRGHIELREGYFPKKDFIIYIDSSNLWLSGQGEATHIVNVKDTHSEMLQLRGVSNVVISDLYIDCNGHSQTTYSNGIGGWGDNVRWENVTIANCYGGVPTEVMVIGCDYGWATNWQFNNVDFTVLNDTNIYHTTVTPSPIWLRRSRNTVYSNCIMPITFDLQWNNDTTEYMTCNNCSFEGYFAVKGKVNNIIINECEFDSGHTCAGGFNISFKAEFSHAIHDINIENTLCPDGIQIQYVTNAIVRNCKTLNDYAGGLSCNYDTNISYLHNECCKIVGDGNVNVKVIGNYAVGAIGLNSDSLVTLALNTTGFLMLGGKQINAFHNVITGKSWEGKSLYIQDTSSVVTMWDNLFLDTSGIIYDVSSHTNWYGFNGTPGVDKVWLFPDTVKTKFVVKSSGNGAVVDTANYAYNSGTSTAKDTIKTLVYGTGDTLAITEDNKTGTAKVKIDRVSYGDSSAKAVYSWDSDKLDGQHGSYYLDNTKDTIKSGNYSSLTDTLKIWEANKTDTLKIKIRPNKVDSSAYADTAGYALAGGGGGGAEARVENIAFLRTAGMTVIDSVNKYYVLTTGTYIDKIYLCSVNRMGEVANIDSFLTNIGPSFAVDSSNTKIFTNKTIGVCGYKMKVMTDAGDSCFINLPFTSTGTLDSLKINCFWN